MGIYCSNCFKEVSTKDNFCQNCGTKIQNAIDTSINEMEILSDSKEVEDIIEVEKTKLLKEEKVDAGNLDNSVIEWDKTAPQEEPSNQNMNIPNNSLSKELHGENENTPSEFVSDNSYFNSISEEKNESAIKEELRLEQRDIEDSHDDTMKPDNLAVNNTLDETSIIIDKVNDEKFQNFETNGASVSPPKAAGSTEKKNADNSQVLKPVDTLGLGGWLLTLFLVSIPMINIVMLIIWSVNATENPSRKKFSQASLILIGITIVLAFSLLLIITVVLGVFMSSLY